MSINEARWAYGQGQFRLTLAAVALERGDTDRADAWIAEAEEITEGTR